MRNTSLCFVLLLVFISISGCSGLSEPMSDPSGTRSEGAINSGSHSCWGIWRFLADPAAGTLEVAPLRGADMHLNVLPFLEPPPFVNLTLESPVKFIGDNLEVDIGLRHPFLGMDEFTGFDVRGILITDGTQAPFNDPELVYAGDDETMLVNADGWTWLFNPTEFPYNAANPIKGYKDGLLGTPYSIGGYSCTLNGYKYFADGLDADEDIAGLDFVDRGYFSAGNKNVRHYIIHLGPQGLIFNYAVDASWQFPSKVPPQVPGDFGPGANCREAFHISVAPVTIFTDGLPVTATIYVYDWQGVDTIGKVEMECPDVWPGAVGFSYAASNEPVYTYTGSVKDELNAGQGTYKGLVTVTDTQADPNFGLMGAYYLFDVKVEEYIPPKADPWPLFRQNAQRNGRNDNITGTSTGFAKWDKTVGGDITSAPVVDIDGNIYFGSWDQYVYSFDVGGGLNWSYDAGSLELAPGALDSEGAFYIGGFGGGCKFIKFDITDGSVIWSKTSGEMYGAYWDEESAPGFNEDKSVVYTGNQSSYRFQARWASDGAEVWGVDASNDVTCPPAIDDKGNIFFVDANGYLHGVTSSGSQFMNLSLASISGGEPGWFKSVIIGNDDQLYVSCAQKWWGETGYLYKINKSSGVSIWFKTYPAPGNHAFYSCLGQGPGADGNLYIGSDDGRLYAISPSDGSTKWYYQTLSGRVRCSPSIDKAGKVYFGGEDGYFYCIKPNVANDGYDIVFQVDLAAEIWASPALNNDGNVAIVTRTGHVVLVGS